MSHLEFRPKTAPFPLPLSPCKRRSYHNNFRQKNTPTTPTNKKNKSRNKKKSENLFEILLEDPIVKSEIAELNAKVISYCNSTGNSAGHLPIKIPPLPKKPNNFSCLLQSPKNNKKGSGRASTDMFSMKKRLNSIQTYIKQLEYNYTGETYYSLKRDRGMKHLVYTAKLIMRESLPIKCVEATYLSVYLTNGFHELLRIPISFKTIMHEKYEHSHIVLAISNKSKWGALGISRMRTLMDKPMKFNSLFELVSEYNKSYQILGHTLIEISVGLPFPYFDMNQSPSESPPILWKTLKLVLVDNHDQYYQSFKNKDCGNTDKHETSIQKTGNNKENNGIILWEDLDDIFTQYVIDCVPLMEFYYSSKRLPDYCNEEYRRGRGVLLTSNNTNDTCTNVRPKSRYRLKRCAV